MPPLSEEDHAIRATGIGSSEIAAVAGEHPFQSPHDVWLRKVGLADETEDTDATVWGQLVEPVVGRRWEMETGDRLVPGLGTQRHPEHPWAVATVDFLTSDRARIVECKHVGARMERHWSTDVADGAPVYVLLQAQWQMGVSGCGAADVAVVFGATSEFRIYRLTFDADIFAALIAIGQKFIRCVEERVAPPIDESDACREVLRALYGDNRKPLLPAPPEAEEIADEYVRQHQAAKNAEAAKALAGNRLCSLIGEHDGVFGDWGYATWKATKKGTRTLRVVTRD